MAQPVVIQRLEEAVDTLTSFEGEAKAAREPLDQLVERANSLTEVVESEGEKTREAIEEAKSTLSELRSRLEEAGQEARGQLEEVTTGAAGLGGEAGSALERVREQLATLGSARETLVEAVAEGVQMTQDDCKEIAAQIEALQSEMNQGLETAREGIETFRSEVGEARMRLAECRNRWNEGLVALESSAQERIATTLDSLRDLFARFTGSFVEAKNEVIDQHNQSMSQLWDNLAEELPEEFEPLFDSLTETISTLEALRAAHAETVRSSCSNVAGFTKDLAGVFDGLSTELGQSAAKLPGSG